MVKRVDLSEDAWKQVLLQFSLLVDRRRCLLETRLRSHFVSLYKAFEACNLHVILLDVATKIIALFQLALLTIDYKVLIAV